MKKHILLLIIILSLSTSVIHAQRGVKIGYIDMEYILQNVPDYTEAKNQLEQKAQKWKQEIETKKIDITKLRDALKTERVLLTKELIDEREEEIATKETELIDYQQKRFGPAGDLTIQKAVLAQPIQDQVFTAAQDIAEAKKFDFIFDKSSDLTMLFAAKRFDISDQVIRVITRSAKRSQLNKKQLKEEEAQEARENMADESPNVAERQKKLDERKAAREKLIADRKAANEEKKNAADEKRKQLLLEKEAKRNGTTVPVKPATENAGKSNDSIHSEVPAKKEVDSTAINAKQKATEARAKTQADRKQALEDKKKKVLEDREAARLAKEQAKQNKTN